MSDSGTSENVKRRTIHGRREAGPPPSRDDEQGVATDDDTRPELSVIIPTYNERENIRRVIERCRAAFDEQSPEIIVVDDDSPDDTWRLAREEYSDQQVTVLRRTDERGLATAVARGFQKATGTFVAVIDADLQHPPEKLPELLDGFEPGVDVVVGSRYVDGGGIENWSRSRRVVSAGASWLAKLAVPSARGIADPMSGFFAVRRTVVEDIDLDPAGYKILMEVLARGEYEGVVEVPYVFSERERGESKLSVSEYVSFVEHVVGLGVVSRGLSRFVAPSRVVRGVEFAAIGVVGTVVNTATFVFGHGLGLHYLLAAAVAFLVAVNWNFVGNWVLTFDQPRSGLLQRYAKFHAVSITGFVVYSVALTVLLEMFSVPLVLANVSAIALSALANFMGADGFAFRGV